MRNILKVHVVNAQVANGGWVPKKPGGCNRNHSPKALEHPTGLPNPQPRHEPPAPSPPQAPVTLEPDGSVERNLFWGDREGTLRTAKLPKLLNPQTPH